MTEKIKYLLGILVLAGLLVVFFYFQQNKQPESPKFTAKEFSGNLLSVEEGFIMVEGVYTKDKKAVDLAQEATQVKIIVSSDTVIRREAFEAPDTEEVFYPDELPLDISLVDLAKLKNDAVNVTIGLQAIAQNNVYGKTEFEAIAITYRVPIFTTPR